MMPCSTLTVKGLVHLQNAIVDPRYAAQGWRAAEPDFIDANLPDEIRREMLLTDLRQRIAAVGGQADAHRHQLLRHRLVVGLGTETRDTGGEAEHSDHTGHPRSWSPPDPPGRPSGSSTSLRMNSRKSRPVTASISALRAICQIHE